MSKNTPVRIDQDLYDDASCTASVQSRSIAQQIAHWARIGRALEASPQFDARSVHQVLAGTMRYDDLGSREQAVVRAEWERGIEEDIRQLDLKQRFDAAGQEYAELDENGQVVIRKPEKSRAVA